MNMDGERSFYPVLRAVFFFTAFSFVCFASVLYVAGNARDFTEKTQVFLLNAVAYSGLSVALCALLNFVFNACFTSVKQKKRISAPPFIFLIFGALSLIFSGVAATILAFMKGNIK
jgi:hypothetical protein